MCLHICPSREIFDKPTTHIALVTHFPPIFRALEPLWKHESLEKPPRSRQQSLISMPTVDISLIQTLETLSLVVMALQMPRSKSCEHSTSSLRPLPTTPIFSSLPDYGAFDIMLDFVAGAASYGPHKSDHCQLTESPVSCSRKPVQIIGKDPWIPEERGPTALLTFDAAAGLNIS